MSVLVGLHFIHRGKTHEHSIMQSCSMLESMLVGALYLKRYLV